LHALHVGFQEIVPLTPGKVLAVEDLVATAEWEAIIGRALNGGSGHAGESGAGAGVGASRARGSAHADVVDPSIVENLWSGKPASAAASAAAHDGWTSFDTPSDVVDSSRSGGTGGGGNAAVATTAAAVEGGWTSFDAPSPYPSVSASTSTIASTSAASSDGGASRPAYVRLACKQLVGVYITVWATADVAAHTRDVRVNTVSTGINLGLGVLGNKARMQERGLGSRV
jgi:phosphatidylinositol-bisphosphatase